MNNSEGNLMISNALVGVDYLIDQVGKLGKFGNEIPHIIIVANFCIVVILPCIVFGRCSGVFIGIFQGDEDLGGMVVDKVQYSLLDFVAECQEDPPSRSSILRKPQLLLSA